MSNQREHRGSASPAIAVVGVSALFPGSSDVRGFWRSIVEGQNQIKEVPPQHWLIEDYYDPNPAAPDKTYGKTGAFLGQVPFDALGYGVPPNVVQQTDTSQLLGLIVAQQVLEDAAGGDFQHLDKSRISVILGATGATELVVHLGSRLQRPIWLNALRANGVPEDEAQAICDRIADSYVPWTEASFPGLLGNVVAGRIANKFDLGGTNCVVDAACASSLSALAMGLGELYLRQSDMVIVGGVDTLNDILMYMCFSKTPALSATGDCSPFSDQADGTILGEGLGMLALRRLEDAERDGDPIYAVIRGIGSSSDGAGTAVYAPKSSGQAHALRRAYAAAGYSPRTVELLEAHGTATKAGDAAEFAGAAGVFAEADPDSRQWCAIGSVKSQIGHTKGAAGAASLIKAVLALHHKVLPPTIKVARPNPNLGVDDSPFYINTQARPWIRDSSHPRRAGVSSFGFGGSNFHVTLEEYTGDSRKDEFRPAPAELFLVSGSDVAEITAAARTLTDGFDGVGGFQFLARASQLSFRSADRLRLAVVASDLADLRSKLEAAAAAIERTPTSAQQSPAGWYYSGDAAANASGNTVGRLAFLFPGQGSQYVGMGGDLAMAFDDSRAVWDEAANLEFGQGNRLPEIVFPRPVFSDDDRASQETRLRATEWAQPAIGVASLSMLALLNRLGVSPDVVGGHSFGEVTALHTAGVLDRKAFFAVARKRGELMAEAAAMFPGAMTAVSHAADAVAALLASWNTGVVIANHNSPEQVVISGIESAIQATEEKLRTAGIRFQRLPVSTAFHSAVVRPAAAPFRTFLEHVAVHRPQLPVYANSTAAAYSTVPDAIRETLAGQIAEPVRFAEQIEAMYAAGVRTFIEVGPGGVLVNLVKSCLKDRPHRAITLDRKGQHGLTSLWHGLGQLAVAGVGLALEQLWADVAVGADPRTRKQPKLAVNISGVNYNKPYPPANGAAGLAAPNPPRNGSHAGSNGQPAVADKGATDKVAAGNGRAASNGPVTPVAPPAARTVQPAAPALPPVTQPVSVQQTPALAAVRPAPTPVATPPPAAVQPAPAPIAAPAPPVASANAGESLAWVQAFQHMQQQTANAHMAFLQVAEQSLRSLEAMLSGARSEGRGFDVSSAERAISAPAPAASAAPAAYAAVIPAPAPSPTPTAAPVTAPAQEKQLPIANGQLPIVNENTPASASLAINNQQLTISNSPPPDLHAIMMAVVTEKTGYPTEMLERGMALDTDLGIDSIKRVEILAAVRERVPSLPEFDTNIMAGLRTLGEIVDYMDGQLGKQQLSMVNGQLPIVNERSASPSLTINNQQLTIDNSPDLHAIMMAVVTEKTGYPTEMLERGMALDTDLGIDSIKRVEILAAVRERVPSLPEFDTNIMAGLRTLGEIVDYMDGQLGKQQLSIVNGQLPIVNERSASPSLTINNQQLTIDNSPDLHAIMMAVVTEKTGYPTEMLERGMALDTDLGIDSIKRVEILAAVRERVPSLPEFDTNIMAGLRTLGEIVDYMDGQLGKQQLSMVNGQLPIVNERSASPSLTINNQQLTIDNSLPDLHAIMMAVVTEKTGYPTEMLERGMALDTDLGIDSIKRVEILAAVRERVPSLPEFDTNIMAGLRTLGEIVDYMDGQLGKQQLSMVNCQLSIVNESAVSPSLTINNQQLTIDNSPDLHAIMMAVVTEKTGYPTEMLERGMALDTDLGIDSIKRVEILAAVRERVPSLPEFDTNIMAGLRTLGEIVDYMDGQLGKKQLSMVNGQLPIVNEDETAPAAQPLTINNGAERPLHEQQLTIDNSSPDPIRRFILETVPQPAPGLAPPFLVDGTPVYITDDGRGIAPQLAARLTESGAQAVVTSAVPADARAVICLDGLRPVRDAEAALAVNAAVFRIATTVAAGYEANGGLFVTVQDTDGDHGLFSASGDRAWLGGLSGLAKTAAQEWPKAVVRAIDLAASDAAPEAVAERLAAELLQGGADREIGLAADGGRYAFVSTEKAASGGAPVVTPDAVVVISGGGRGVTAATAVALAQSTRPRIALLGRTTLEDEPAELRTIADDAGLKKALLAAALANGRRITPRELGVATERILAGREIRATLAALHAAGSEAIYLSCDVTDPAATAVALGEIRARLGPITGIVHGAGVLADKRLAEKTSDDFQRVFGAKISGLRSLLAATADDPLNVICLFSSVAARTGNAGQADYAMANEVLNRVAHELAHTRPGCVVKSIGWGPWAGGMVTPVLKAKFDEMGVPLIPLENGAQRFVAELQQADRSEVETVIGGAPQEGPLINPQQAAGARAADYDVVISAATDPYLRSHEVNGVVVVPLVLVQEWFLRAANAAGAAAPYNALRKLRVLKGIPLPAFGERPARLRVHIAPDAGDPAALTATLYDDAGVARFAAQVVLQPPESAEALTKIAADSAAWPHAAVAGAALYGAQLFHGPAFATLQQVDRLGEHGARADLIGSQSVGWDAPRPSPLALHWFTDPALIDGGLQLARVWGYARLQQLTLPTAVETFVVYEPGLLADGRGVRCIVEGKPIGQAGTRTNLWFVDGNSGALIAAVRGLEMYKSSEAALVPAQVGGAQ